MKKLFGLGKGLESLIPTQSRPPQSVPNKKEDIFYVETGKIQPNSEQPRQAFDKSGLKELAASIKRHGVLQPLLVSKVEKETNRGIDIEYELIAGERRLRAAKLARMPHVPVIIKNNLDDDKIKLEVALVENLQREDLSPLEEADAYARLSNDFGLTQKVIATRVGKSREVVANTLRLLDLPDNIKDSLRSGKISRTHARTLLAFKDEDKQQETFREIISGKMPVHHVESKAREHKREPSEMSIQLSSQRFLNLEKNLAKNLGTTVAIRDASKGGRIEIRFATLEELNKIAKVILG
ncbi:MAG: ParB/RepB/Spo0J family partition protein [Parcubacteria group bacterium]